LSSSNRLRELENRIEKLRKKMVHTASEQGFTSNESIHLSQKLDDLISEYLNLKVKNKRMHL